MASTSYQAAKKDNTMYANSTIGLCTCRSGQQGEFCKHQVLVHKVFGGTFSNAPLLTREGRHELGRLALGDACPGSEFFKGLHENSSEPQAAPTEHLDGEQSLEPSTGTSCRPSSSQEIQENKGMDSYRDMLCSFEHLESLAMDNPACSKYAASIAKHLKRVTNQQALVEVLIRVCLTCQSHLVGQQNQCAADRHRKTPCRLEQRLETCGTRPTTKRASSKSCEAGALVSSKRRCQRAFYKVISQ